MTMSVGHNITLEDALADAERRYTEANPKSLARHRKATSHLPGGNTRSNMWFSPFPVTIARGDGAHLEDLDGHRYSDFLGEYTAGLYGHSHPVIRRAIDDALDHGIGFGGPNRWEGQLADLLCERFPSLDLVRFCNSGTEANLYAISTARAVTGRTHLMAFKGGYHGGVFLYSTDSPLNAPFPLVLASYNDLEGTRALLARHGAELAAVVIEPMMGSGGGIAAEPEFLAMLRAETRARGIVLIFDEVMTSRLSPGGLQAKLGLVPDMTTFGKYLGGGMSFGAFGGRADLMERFDPSRPDAFQHAGTYNNNVLSLAAGVAGLTEVFTPAAAIALNERGDLLRARINAVFERHGAALQMLGSGSINSIHFHANKVRRPEDVAHDPQVQVLFHLEMLERGVYLARRGFSSLSLPLADPDYEKFVQAVEEFCAVYVHVLPKRKAA